MIQTVLDEEESRTKKKVGQRRKRDKEERGTRRKERRGGRSNEGSEKMKKL